LLPVKFLGRKVARPSSAASGTGRLASSTEARRDEGGVLIHAARSPYQASTSSIRVLLPDDQDGQTRFPIVYVLLVEPRDGHPYGDGLHEVQRHGLQDKFESTFGVHRFSHLPWHADHPTER
jgi:hypothetical protein